MKLSVGSDMTSEDKLACKREINRRHYYNNRDNILLKRRLHYRKYIDKSRILARVYSSKNRAKSYIKNIHKRDDHDRKLVAASRSGRLTGALSTVAISLKRTKERKKMNNSKMLSFVKRWRDLEAQRAKLDYERAKWCHDVRIEFAVGASGDREFLRWLGVELSVHKATALELLERANAHRVVPDEKVWDRVGGFSNVRCLTLVPERERVEVIEAAKVESRTIRSVLRSRGALTARQISASNNSDVVKLARYLATQKGLPKDITRIVSKYVPKVQS